MSFKDKTVFITGASRGIGKAIGLRLAREGAHIVIAAKSVEENPKLGGTIFTAAKEIDTAGGKALPVQCDIRFTEQIEKAVHQAVKQFGGIDILINNASAIALTAAENTTVKSFDLMHDINVRGTFFVSKACIPYLKKSENAHILNLSPPINLDKKWLGPHVAYTMSKYDMSLIALGLAEELKPFKIACNCLWPKTTIATAAVRNLLGGQKIIERSRTPEILADSAYFILKRSSVECTGNCFIDEEVLRKEGVTNLSKYDVVKGSDLFTDLFL